MRKVLKRWGIIVALVLLFAAGLGFYYRGEIGAGFADGAAYAQEHRQGECVAESLAQLIRRDDLAGSAYVMAFSRECARRAAPDPSFCAEIPDGIMDAVAWISGRCAAYGEHAKACRKVYQHAGSACAGTLP